MITGPPKSTRTYTLFPDTTLFRSVDRLVRQQLEVLEHAADVPAQVRDLPLAQLADVLARHPDAPGVGSVLPVQEPQHRRLPRARRRSEEHTSELQLLMRISYAVFCLKKNKKNRKYR